MSRKKSRLRCGIVPLCFLVWLGTAAWSAAQAPPPRPQPRPEAEGESRDQPPPRRRGPVTEAAPPPPVLRVSSDMDCRLELDGQPLGELRQDRVEEFRVKTGAHLLQAFPAGIEGPVWRKSFTAPDTGTVVEIIDLRKVVEDWIKKEEKEEEPDVGRWEERERVLIDHQSGLMWARHVSPEMSWDQVQGYCTRLNLDDVDGWRFPVLDELSTLHFSGHETPRQELAEREMQKTLLGRRRTSTEVLPREIRPELDHNSVGTLWIQDQQARTACGFLGGFNCRILRSRAPASVLCVRSVTPVTAAAGEASPGQD